jgi:hypothetical protein
MIWIEEETRYLQEEGKAITPKSMWEKEPEKEEQQTAPKPLPGNDKVKQILQAVVTDVLTNPDLKGTREFYGTEKDKTVALIDGDTLGWPKEFNPVTKGYTLVQPSRDPFANQRRIMAIRIDKFDLKQLNNALWNSPIEVCVFNGGGNANGAVIGGCSVYYEVKKVGKRWTVSYTGLLDP